MRCSFLERLSIRTYLTDTLRYYRQGQEREYASRSCACLEVKLHIPCFVINRLTYIYTDSLLLYARHGQMTTKRRWELSTICTLLYVHAESVHRGARKRGERRRDGKGGCYTPSCTYTHTHTHKLSSREGDFLSVLLSAAQNNSIKPLCVPEIKGAEGVNSVKRE